MGVFEQVFSGHGKKSQEALAILKRCGELAAIDHLSKQHHSLGGHKTTSEPEYTTGDDVYIHHRYIFSSDPEEGRVRLEYAIEW